MGDEISETQQQEPPQDDIQFLYEGNQANITGNEQPEACAQAQLYYGPEPGVSVVFIWNFRKKRKITPFFSKKKPEKSLLPIFPIKKLEKNGFFH